ncbi:hypothetical protein RchiOBHm_Chr4g0411841 [Rosa chinensis]|uniref:Uncharacterized protein n=1 Tax=Rosa chinensis TaxID=74649 RepID=A0A2P6QVP8_ROSCH|nr:hypothetical protein RchiOBHm_Chr4g0411841 [Rosa chinensis]
MNHDSHNLTVSGIYTFQSKARILHSWFALFGSPSSCDSVKLGDSSLEKFWVRFLD